MLHQATLYGAGEFLLSLTQGQPGDEAQEVALAWTLELEHVLPFGPSQPEERDGFIELGVADLLALPPQRSGEPLELFVSLRQEDGALELSSEGARRALWHLTLNPDSGEVLSREELIPAQTRAPE